MRVLWQRHEPGEDRIGFSVQPKQAAEKSTDKGAADPQLDSTIIPSGSEPGITSLATTPETNPKSIQPRIAM